MKIHRAMALVAAGSLLAWGGLSAQATQQASPPDAKPSAQEAAPSPSPSATSSVQVVKMVLCRDVKDREPGEELTTAKVGDVIAGWTQIQSAEDTTVTHRWIHEGVTVSDIPLHTKGYGGARPYRTWSKKTIGAAGNWKWQVLDQQGNVLKELAFTAAP